jgi:small GTP-binding protein
VSERVRVTVTTASTAGAVALIQLHGRGAADLLSRVTGKSDWIVARVRLSDLAGVDEGLAVLLRDDWGQLMPHGGPRVVHKLLDRLLELGACYDAEPAARELYPEAASDLEADMLATLARAASPAAIDLLLAQPALWERWERERHEPPADILRRSDALDRLVTPPTVVVVGRPNVGKSTLTNRMLGRTASIVADLPGTTRDWVAGLADIQGVAVRWLDTPGLRDSGDPIEQRAIALAQRVVAEADVLIAMREPEIEWPEKESLPREPDLWITNKSDIRSDEERETASVPVGSLAVSRSSIRISAATGQGIPDLQRAILARLSLADLSPRVWAFSPSLRRRLAV